MAVSTELKHVIEVTKAYAEARASSIAKRISCHLSLNTELKHGIEVTKAYSEARASLSVSLDA
jgi:hypothetical protein